MSIIKNGDLVYIIYDKRRKWVRKALNDNEFHSDRGFIKFNEIIGKNYGETAFLHPSNHKVAILPALFSDIIYFMKRQSQIIYPEDIGLILTYGGVRPGYKILEAGTGSGTVTSIMGIFSQPGGHVLSFDIRDIAIKQARKNIKTMKSESNCSVELGDICEEDFNFEDIDFVLLDLATTWKAVPKVVNYFKGLDEKGDRKGRICCFSPNLEQVKKNHRVLKENNFKSIITLELIKRIFQVKPNATRPIGRVVGHTGYLTFATQNPEIEPLIPDSYYSYYSPENIGYILVYLGCQPGDRILLICLEDSPLPELFNKYYNINGNIEIIKIRKNSNPNGVQNEVDISQSKEIQDLINSYHSHPSNPSNSSNPSNQINKKSTSSKFKGIIIDSIKSDFLVKKIHGLLENGMVLCILSQYIEIAKNYHEQMKNLNYYDISTCELIKRTIEIEPEGSFSTLTTEPLNTPGYITTGRKIIDNPPDQTKVHKPHNNENAEFIETVLDVAVNFPESLPEEKEKIDYANLREE